MVLQGAVFEGFLAERADGGDRSGGGREGGEDGNVAVVGQGADLRAVAVGG